MIRRDYHLLLLPLVSGIVMVFAYSPFSVPVLPFIGFVPLLIWLSRPLSVREMTLGSLAFAVPYFCGNLYWLFVLGSFTHAGYAGAAGLILMHLTTFFIFTICLTALNRIRPLPLAVSAPVLWVVTEHPRNFGDFQFPWVTLGYSLGDWPRLAQHADLVGVYGLSFWLVLVNALAASLFLARRKPRARLVYAAILAAALLVPAVYNPIRYRRIVREVDAAPRVEIAVVQPNVPQVAKWRPETVDTIYDVINRSVAEADARNVDLVAAPEASLPLPLPVGAARLPDEIRPGRIPLLIGGLIGIGEGDVRQVGSRTITVYQQHYNAAILATPDRSILAWRGKHYLVPVTEQFPYRKTLGFLLPLMTKQFGRFVPGDEPTPLELETARGRVPFAALVCYESIFPELPRSLRNQGARFFVVVTNDAWFGRTSFPYQHAAISAIRAIETRTPVVQAANTGISFLYDAAGRSTHATRIFEKDLFTASVPLAGEPTVYARTGDLVLWLSYAAALVFLALAWGAHRRGRAVGLRSRKV